MLSTLFDNCRDTIHSFLEWFSTAIKQTTAAYCDLETADDTYTFAAHNGGLVSIIRVNGTTELIGQDELARLHQQFTQSLEGAMAQPGHTIQVVFDYDPVTVDAQLKKLLAPSQYATASLQLALDDLIDERIRHLSKYCGYERLYIVLWTKPNHLNKQESKQAEKDKLHVIHTKKLTPFRLTQNIIAAIPLLRNTHEMFVRSVLEQLLSLKFQATLLEVHEASFEIRQLADPEFTQETWRASLPGDPVPLKEYPRYQDNICDLLWPSLARQLLPRDAENLDLRSVRFGDRIYTCLFVDLLPKEMQAFNQLLKYTIPANVPFRISFLADSDSLHQLKFKSLLATVLSFSSEENRLLSNANDLLHYINTHSDEAIVQLKMTLCTWAKVGEMDLLRRRAAALARALQSWGVQELSEVSGDPFEGLITTLPGVTANSIATPTLLPLSSMVQLLPLARPASPWLAGTQLFRTPEGKPWPFQPGSHLQTTWIDLMYAGPGSGKSVLSNTLNLSACLRLGTDSLPYLSIIDIGSSSKGFISLLKEALPKEKQHQVAYYALRVDARYTINPFDTQLGARYPSPEERSFLINLLTLLATPIEKSTAYDGIAEMIRLIIDELYKQLADSNTPHKYTPNVSLDVDQRLKTLDITVDAHTTWWEVTDSLFIAGYIETARLAQRYAMPLLADLAHATRLPTVYDLYKKMVTETGETLIDAFSRMISSAIREYPMLAGITQFDPSASHVVALDLAAVTKSGSRAADRQTAVMYMLARYVLTRNSYLSNTLLETVPNHYHSYHQDRIHQANESTKRIVFDEFHRTGATKIVRDQIMSDMREGRKRNIQIALISQSLDDFDPLMIELATSTYILDAGTTQTIEKSANIFGLSPTAQELLRTQVKGPQSSGVTFLAQFATTEGLTTQLLTLTLSPTELWALNTSVEDTLLRDRLYKTLGPVKARAILATLFPEGTARTVIASRLLNNDFKKTEENNTIKISLIEELYHDILQEAASIRLIHNS